MGKEEIKESFPNGPTRDRMRLCVLAKAIEQLGKEEDGEDKVVQKAKI